MSKKPSEIEPRLKEEYLCHIAKIIAEVRTSAMHSVFNPIEGDGAWGIGCLIYERTINSIEREAGISQWLKVIKKGLYFIILIDGVPLKFKKDNIDNPSSNSLVRKAPELEAQLAFSYYQPTKWFWRLFVETDDEGGVLGIFLAQINSSSNSCINRWQIPFSMPVSASSEVPPYQPQESVVQEKPAVTPRYESVEGKKNGTNK